MINKLGKATNEFYQNIEVYLAYRINFALRNYSSNEDVPKAIKSKASYIMDVKKTVCNLCSNVSDYSQEVKRVYEYFNAIDTLVQEILYLPNKDIDAWEKLDKAFAISGILLKQNTKTDLRKLVNIMFDRHGKNESESIELITDAYYEIICKLHDELI